MKTMLLTFVILQSLANTISAAESSKWVTGPFWRAKQVEEVGKKLISKDSALAASCANFTEIINTYKKMVPNESMKQRIDEVRKRPLSTSMQLNFRGTFSVADTYVSSKMELELDLSKNESASENMDTLPQYTQLKSFTDIYLSDMKDFKVKVLSDKDSLTSYTRDTLGLPESEVTVSQDSSGRIVLFVSGRDLACDLLNKTASLTAKIPSNVRLTEESSQELGDFYQKKLSSQVAKVLSESSDKELAVTAAKLGYRIGKTLEEKDQRYSDEVVETQLKNLMKLLFVPGTLQRSGVFAEDKKTINFRSSETAMPVTMNLEVL